MAALAVTDGFARVAWRPWQWQPKPPKTLAIAGVSGTISRSNENLRGEDNMVVIRLARTGAKKKPFYHVVATDKRNARDGRYIEQLGFYNPVARGNELRINLNNARIEHWISQGAQPSERVQKIMKLSAKGDVNAKPIVIPTPKAG